MPLAAKGFHFWVRLRECAIFHTAQWDEISPIETPGEFAPANQLKRKIRRKRIDQNDEGIYGGETGTLGEIKKYIKNKYMINKVSINRFQFRFHFGWMRWAAGVLCKALAGVMALGSRWNRSVLGYKGLLSALKRIEIFVSDVGRATSGK